MSFHLHHNQANRTLLTTLIYKETKTQKRLGTRPKYTAREYEGLPLKSVRKAAKQGRVDAHSGNTHNLGRVCKGSSFLGVDRGGQAPIGHPKVGLPEKASNKVTRDRHVIRVWGCPSAEEGVVSTTHLG